MTRPSVARPRTRWHTGRWVVLGLIVIIVVGALGTHLTAPRPGGRMDPEATSPEGARALVTLLGDHGVDVITAATAGEARRAARPGTLLVAVQTLFLYGDEQLRQLAEAPGDLLLVEPVAKAREALAPALDLGESSAFGCGPPVCELADANLAGEVQFGLTDTYRAAGDVAVTRCYGGAVARYHDDGRTVTVVGTADFMANSGLLNQGNAALAMNLAGTRPTVIWYAPQRFEGESTGGAKLSDVIPDQVRWIVLQLCLVVVALAVWQARRIGPLVAESLPVVVRASETVEGRGRLYRSHRARDRAADALRTATLQRLLPRLGLTAGAVPPAVTTAVAARCARSATEVGHLLFGPPPATDSELVHLAHQLDDIERQVTQS